MSSSPRYGRAMPPSSSSFGFWHARRVRLVTSLLTVALVLPATVVTGQERDPSEIADALDRARQRESDVAGQVEGLRSDVDVARDELRRLEASLIQARQRLNLLEGQVALAEDALAEAEAEREQADADLEAAEELLAETQAELAAQEQVLAEQVADSFKYGSANQAALMLEIMRQAQDVGDVAVGLYQLGAVVDHQGNVVDEVERLRAQRERLRAETASKRRAAAQAAADAAMALERIEKLKAEAKDVAAAIAADQQSQQDVLAGLEADAADKESLLTEVRSDTNALAAELAKARAKIVAAETAREAARAAERAPSPEDDDGGGGGGPATGSYTCPVAGAVVGWDFINDWGFPRSGGRRHQGTDVFAARGTPVVAMADATIERVQQADSGLGGRTIFYTVADGSDWYMAHLDSIAGGIAPGVAVDRGQQIGAVGNTGNARTTPPHAHVGHYYGLGNAVNPYADLAAACR